MASENSLPKRILMFGATGLIGKYIISELYNARSSFDKIGFFTSPKTNETKSDEVNGWKAKGIEVIVGDMNSEDDVKKAFQDYDTVISALGRDAILSQLPLLKLAEASSTIHTFYPSEYGTDIEYAPSSASEKPHQLKLQVRKYIREQTKKLRITYLVTGPYSDLFFAPARGHQHAGSFDPKEKKAVLLGTGEERISFTTMKDVGRLLVAALRTPTSSQERILKVNSFTATGKEILAEFEKQTGTKWHVGYTSIEKLRELEREAWEKNSPLKTVFTLRRIWTEGGTLYEHRDNGSIGFEEEERLDEQVEKMIALYN